MYYGEKVMSLEDLAFELTLIDKDFKRKIINIKMEVTCPMPQKHYLI